MATFAPRFTADSVWTAHGRNLRAAERSLQALPFWCGANPNFRGLSGWVFEQTVQQCLKKELRAHKIAAEVTEQVSMKGRSKADLRVGNVLIEIKLSGIYGSAGFEKYRMYRRNAEVQGFHCLFLTGEESYEPNRILVRKTFGPRNAFFLDPEDEWPAFVARVISLVTLR